MATLPQNRYRFNQENINNNLLGKHLMAKKDAIKKFIFHKTGKESGSHKNCNSVSEWGKRYEFYIRPRKGQNWGGGKNGFESEHGNNLKGRKCFVDAHEIGTEFNS
jgi:hypothetical protein